MRNFKKLFVKVLPIIISLIIVFTTNYNVVRAETNQNSNDTNTTSVWVGEEPPDRFYPLTA
jgi:hypothetical protein